MQIIEPTQDTTIEIDASGAAELSIDITTGAIQIDGEDISQDMVGDVTIVINGNVKSVTTDAGTIVADSIESAITESGPIVGSNLKTS